MFLVLVYDVSPQRDARVLKVCRQYLTWVQNSVFEGQITDAQVRVLWRRLGEVINGEQDSVVAYCFDSLKYSERLLMGVRKGGEEWIL